MATLYELTDVYGNLMEMLYDEDLDTSELINILEELEDNIETKADNYAKVIKNMTSDIAAIKEELNRLKARKTALENKSKILKINLESAMRKAGKLKFKTELFSFNIQKNAPSVYIENETNFIEWARENRDDFLIFKDPDINKTAIKEALTVDGEIIDGAEMRQTESLRIR